MPRRRSRNWKKISPGLLSSGTSIFEVSALLIFHLFRYKALLEKALGNAPGASSSGAWMSTESPSLRGGDTNRANKVTTGSSSGTRTTVSSLSSVQNSIARGEKLGTYAAGLQNKFVTTLTGVKRAAGSMSTASDHGSDTSAHRDPSPLLKRSASSASVGTHSFNTEPPPSLGLVRRQSSVQELKSLLKKKRADGPLDSLDPYLTDASSAAATPSCAQARVPLSPASTANSPASAQSGPQLFSSDDKGSYWTESDAGSAVYDRQRDLEGGASTDDGGYGTDGSSARQQALEARRPQSAAWRGIIRSRAVVARMREPTLPRRGVRVRAQGCRQPVACWA